MPYEELLNWIEYFKRRPLGWREDQRTFMLLKAQGVKEKVENLFPTLSILKENRDNKFKDDQALPKGKILEMMLQSKDGDSSGWKPNFRGSNENKP
jgi:hypothetical protein